MKTGLLSDCKLLHYFTYITVNPLPDDKVLELTKLKAFADVQLKVAEMTIFLFDRAENTVRKGENAGNQHFLLFPPCFPKPSSLILSQTSPGFTCL